jgi:homoserine dehydrogenase
LVVLHASLTGFEGILNGTSNSVPGRKEAGLGFSEAVSEAQSLGYAEADPTADVEGHDVRLKVVILAIVSVRDVRMVSFTGGSATGEAISRSAGLKKLAMDLGGNAPVIVMAGC